MDIVFGVLLIFIVGVTLRLYAQHKRKVDDSKKRVTAEWDDDDERIDIIGQNGNDGLHYDKEKNDS